MIFIAYRLHSSLRSRSRSRSSSPGHSGSVQTSVIQSTKAFSQQQHVNGSGASSAVASDGALEGEPDGDVEMQNGSAQNGSSHLIPTHEGSVDNLGKDDSLLDMGTQWIEFRPTFD